MPNKSAEPITNKFINSEIKNFVSDKNYNRNEYLDIFEEWINNTKLNELYGLQYYKSKRFTYGTTQSFDHFYLKHRNRRFRFFTGEFMYHQASMKNNLNWKYLTYNDLDTNDAVIISVPFSDTGNIIRDLDYILKKCCNLTIPVLLDLAYFPVSKNIKLNLSYSCIETITFSLSKAFDGAQFLRAGIRFQKQDDDDGIDIFNSVNMLPSHTLNSACFLMNKYNIDYNWNTYSSLYDEICKKYDLEPTDCIMFGISRDKFQEFNRGNSWNRVCISKDIGELYDRSKS